MSLILEALRKSEAQRQLGNAPNLHSATPLIRRERRLPPWLVPALVLMAVGAMAWGLGRMAVPDPGNGDSAPSPAVLEEPIPLPLQPRAAAAVDSAPSVPSQRVGPARPPVAADAGAPAPDAAPSAPPAPAAARTPSPSPAADPAPPSTSGQSTSVPAPAPAPAPAVAEVDPPAPAIRTGASAAGDVEEDLLRLSDLPASQRADLPELRITMHVYSEDRDRRFAIIDGRRVGEGALLPGSAVVDEIRRDGIVVDLGGRRVLLPRP